MKTLITDSQFALSSSYSVGQKVTFYAISDLRNFKKEKAFYRLNAQPESEMDQSLKLVSPKRTFWTPYKAMSPANFQ